MIGNHVRRYPVLILSACLATCLAACGGELLDPEEPDPLDVDIVTREDLRSETLARDDSISFDEDPHPPGESVRVDVLTNDRGPGLRVASCDCETTLGTVSIEEGELVLSADPNVFGIDSIEYTAVGSDSFGVATAVLVIHPINDPPRPVEGADRLNIVLKQVGDDTTFSIASVFEDPDGDALQYRIDPTETVNTIEPDPEAQQLRVVANEKGLETVSLIAIDDSLSESEPVSLEIMVGNRPPENFASLPMIDLFVGQSDTLDLDEFFRDPDGDPVSYAASSNASRVRSEIDSSRLTVEGISTTTGELVSITASDDQDSTTATLTVDVQENSPPVFVATETMEVFKRAETTIPASDLFSDDFVETLDLQIIEGPSSGILTAAVTNDPPQFVVMTGAEVGLDSVRLEAFDGVNSASGTVILEVINRNPEFSGSEIVTVNGAVGFDILLTLDNYFIDPDDDPLQYGVDTTLAENVGSVLDYELSGTRNEMLLITPKAADTKQFWVTADDGLVESPLRLTVTLDGEANPPPQVIAGLDSIVVSQDTTISMLDYVEDPGPPGDTLVIESVNIIDDGDVNLSLNTDGLPSVEIVIDNVGVDTVLVVVSDRAGTENLRLFVRASGAPASFMPSGKPGMPDSGTKTGSGLLPRRE